MQSFRSLELGVFELFDWQTEWQTNKATKQKDYTSPALAGAGDYNKPTKQKDYTSPALAGAGDYN